MNEQAEIDRAVRDVQHGHVDAFEVIVRFCERPVRAWLATCARPGIDIDEIAQRAFVAAFTRLDEYEVGTNFPAWLNAIARYQLMTEQTRLRRVADYHARFGHELIGAELDGRAELTENTSEERLQQLKTCVGKLPESFRELIGWRYTEEVSLEEMSARTGRTVPAIKKQLWTIRRRLQECIERHSLTGATS